MTTLISNENPPALATSGLSIHIVQPGSDDRVVPLPTGKCTVGSSDRCQVQLPNTSAQPLHCLIVHDGSDTSITRWAPGALLNDQDFATAPFHSGDRLQIGEVQLVLVTESNPEPKPQQPEPAAPSAVNSAFAALAPTTAKAAIAPPSVSPEAPIENTTPSEPIPTATPPTVIVENAADAAAAEQLADRLKLANRSARQRCRKLVDAMRSMRQEASDFDENLSELQQQLTSAVEDREQVFAQFSQLQIEAAQRESHSSVELDRLTSELTAAHEKASAAEAVVAEHASHAEQLQSKLAESQQQRTEWELLCSASDLERNELTETLADREQSITRLQSELDQARESANNFETSCHQQSASLESLRAEVDHVSSEREQIAASMSQALAERDERIESLQSELAESRESAGNAEATCREQSATLENLQAELEQVSTEREQLQEAHTQSQQIVQAAEQAVADSEQNLLVLELEVEKLRLTSSQIEQDLADRSAGYEDLELQHEQLCQQRDEWVAKRTEYQLREQSWEHDLSSRDSQISELQTQLAELQSAQAEADQGVAEHAEQVAELQRQLTELVDERDKLRDAQAAQGEIDRKWEQTVEARDRRIKELEEEHDGICHVLQSVEQGAFEQVDFCNKLENQLATLRAERDELASALPEQHGYIAQLEKTLAERDEQITLVTDELTNTTRRQSELENEISASAEASQAVKAEMEQLSARCEQLLAEQSTSEQNKAAIEQSLAEYKDQTSALQHQLENAAQQRLELEQALAEGSQSSDSAQEALSELQARYEQLTIDHQSESERRAELDKQLAERQQDVELFQVDVKSIRAELDRSMEQVTELQTERDTLNRQLTGLREELEAQEAARDAGVGRLQQQRGELTDELASVRGELEQLQQQLDAPNDEETQLQEMVAKLENENSELQQRVEQQERQTVMIGDELEQARQGLQAAEQALQERAEQQERQTVMLGDELEQAKQGLQVAEQALQERAEQQERQTIMVGDEPEQARLGLQVAEQALQECAESHASEQQPTCTKMTNQTIQLPLESVDQSDDASTHDAVSPTENVGGTLILDSDTYDSRKTVELAPVSWDLPADTATETHNAESPADVDHCDVEQSDTPDEVGGTEVGDADVGGLDEQVAPDEEDETDRRTLQLTTTAFDVQQVEPEEPAAEFQPPSFIDEYQHILDDDNLSEVESIDAAAPEPAQVENQLGAEIDASGAGPEGESDEAALEAYMSNMLRRMRGEGSDDGAQLPPVDATTELKQNPDPVVAVDNVLDRVAPEREVADEPHDVEPLDMEQLRQSSRKPALPTDLSAMRELANSSARRAIAKHYKRRHLEKALGLFFVCLIAIGVGGYMLFVAAEAQNFLSAKFIGGAAAVLVGVVGGFKLLGLLLLAIREGAWEKTSAAQKTVKQDSSVADLVSEPDGDEH